MYNEQTENSSHCVQHTPFDDLNRMVDDVCTLNTRKPELVINSFPPAELVSSSAMIS